ncbi:hypothetical protein NEMIN01_1847 [Nematocida minor]|uniref:uncharacterized protein n=1 Tax=Nematocida minor TaxID=1912983 RepID=UPI00222031A9|nr:uncharacterized protein NEMIN01_1847 [Nematocida minor]KAI5192154.1 hypothetical protein NEMIN01_1847 [Nematocida minor]
MNFVYISSVSQSMKDWTGMMLSYDVLKLAARAGITCCFLNGRGFKSVHEVGISLIYVYILLTLEPAPLKNIAMTILFSFLFTICMHLSLQLRKSRVAVILCSIFCIWDLFAAINLSQTRSLPYLFGVSLFSMAVLFILYIDGRRRPGIKQCMMKDVAMVGFFILKYAEVPKYEVYPYIISAILMAWSVLDCIAITKQREETGEVSDSSAYGEIREKKVRRKAAIRELPKVLEKIKKTQTVKKEKIPAKEKKKSSDSASKDKKQKPKYFEEAPPAAKSATPQKSKPLRSAAKEARKK